MSADMKFAGSFHFDDEDDLAEAVADAGALLESEDPDLAEILQEMGAFDVGHKRVSIDVDFSGPSEWFLAIEALVETFAARASSGRVACWYEEEEMDPYEAGPTDDDPE